MKDLNILVIEYVSIQEYPEKVMIVFDVPRIISYVELVKKLFANVNLYSNPPTKLIHGLSKSVFVKLDFASSLTI